MPHPQSLGDAEGKRVGAEDEPVDVKDQRPCENDLALDMLPASELFDNSPVAQLMMQPFGAVTRVNHKFVELTGYDRDAIVGRDATDLDLFVDASDRLYIRNMLTDKAVIDGFETRIRCSNAELLDVLLSSRTIRVNGRDSLLHSFVDVTQARRAYRAAQLSQKCVEAVSEGVLIAGPDRRVLYVNPAFEQLTGYGLADLEGGNCAVLQGPQTDPRTVLALRQALAEGRQHNCEILNYRKDGQSFWNELRISPVYDAGGSLTHFVGFQRDVTEQKHTQSRLRLAEQMFSQGREGLTVTDPQGTIIMVNQAFTDITGYTRREVMGRNPSILASGRHDRSFYAAMWDALHHRGVWRGEIWNRRKNGEIYPEWLTIRVLLDEDGGVGNYVGSFADISEAKAAQERIDWLSNFDKLTSLPNRTLLAERCNHDIAAARRTDRPLALMALGLTNLETLNLTFDRSISDNLLLQISQRLLDTVRDEDMVSRTGDKEFMLVLPGDTPDGAATLAVRLQDAVSEPFTLDGIEMSVTLSVGIAVYPMDGTDFEQLSKAATLAMHEASNRNDGKPSFFSAELFELTRSRGALISALRNAVRLGQLELHYQPFADLATGRICGMEALLRWQHPELGRVSPAQFIPAAEESGLIVEIGAWVIDRACADIRLAREQGLRDIPISVNLSPVQFRKPGLVAQIASSLEAHGVPGPLLCVEVTEGALIEDVGYSRELLQEIKSLGVRLSLDDFGTGYSSLSYLKLFPFDKVKIDQSFVRDILTSTQDAVIAKVVISMAHGLGLSVIAEGVETDVQCEFMRNNACDEIQGYFFARPMPVLQALDLLREDHQLPPHLVQFTLRKRTLLLVDDEPNVLTSLKRLLRGGGYEILTAPGGPQALELLASTSVDVILSDQRMPGMTGVELLREVKQRFPETIRIVLSGFTELQSVTDAINEGAVYRFLTKPWNDEQLLGFVDEAFRHKELEDENRQLNLKVMQANKSLTASNRQTQSDVVVPRAKASAAARTDVLPQLAFAAVPWPLLVVDIDTVVELGNQAAEALLAPTFGPLRGARLANLVPEIDVFLDTANEGERKSVRLVGREFAIQWHPIPGAQAPLRRMVSLLARRSSASDDGRRSNFAPLFETPESR